MEEILLASLEACALIRMYISLDHTCFSDGYVQNKELRGSGYDRNCQ